MVVHTDRKAAILQSRKCFIRMAPTPSFIIFCGDVILLYYTLYKMDHTSIIQYAHWACFLCQLWSFIPPLYCYIRTAVLSPPLNKPVGIRTASIEGLWWRSGNWIADKAKSLLIRSAGKTLIFSPSPFVHRLSLVPRKKEKMSIKVENVWRAPTVYTFCRPKNEPELRRWSRRLHKWRQTSPNMFWARCVSAERCACHLEVYCLRSRSESLKVMNR